MPRSANSYRGVRKNSAKAVGMSLARYNQVFDIAARAAEAAPAGEGPEAARKKLAIWAANGGRETAIGPAVEDRELDRLNSPAFRALSDPVVVQELIEDNERETAIEAAKKITPADVDEAMESALTGWQDSGRVNPMPLSKIFAARARQLGWAEGVEFVEEK